MFKNQNTKKRIAITLLVLILNDLFAPALALALTSGPSQPEAFGFKPVNASNMVDLFTGDFSYNIPLMDVDGYPLNLSYSGNPGMDDEASWVGLGWSFNPGVMNRDLRGFPDDFKKETIEKEYNVIDDVTSGVSIGGSFEAAGIGPNISGGIFYNNITGWGKEQSTSLQFNVGKIANASVGTSYNSKSGLDVSAGAGLSFGFKKDPSGSYSVKGNASMNSRSGIKQMDFGVARKRNVDAQYNSADMSSAFNFSQPAFFPTNPMPIKNSGITGHVTVGGEILPPLHPSIMGNYYRQTQKLVSNYDKQSANGYIYQGEQADNGADLQDYSKEKPIAYREDVPNLTLSYGTYDLFSASGQGAGGQFRAYRNDVGMLRNAWHINSSQSGTIGVKIGVGNVFHSGFDANTTMVDSKTNGWSNDNYMKDKSKFEATDKAYEGVYFKAAGEMNVNNNSAFVSDVLGYNPVKVGLDRNKKDVTAINRYEGNGSTSKMVAANLKNNQRTRRNQTFSYLTAAQLSARGTKNYESYELNKLPIGCSNTAVKTNIATKGGIRKDHHIAEVTLTQASGERYIYGIPTYNVSQREATFSVNKNSFTTNPVNKGLTKYVSPQVLASTTQGLNTTVVSAANQNNTADNSIKNKRGRDNYFEASTLPAYANAFLLSSVVSPDYVDVKNDGITDDDLGNYTKLNYTKTKDEFKWRSPVTPNHARYQAGNKSDDLDDKASYVFGKKEVWYLHSLEGRTMVAQLYLSARQDGLGVIDENGGHNIADKLQKLDSIKLFSKSEIMTKGATAIPIKTVHFRYTYDLCKGLPNAVDVAGALSTTTGKLTLSEVFFTYADNNKGCLNRYKFKYKQPTVVNYDLEKTDRWGSFRDITRLGTNAPESQDFPYTLQDEDYYNNPTTGVAGLWSLNEIELPSGGKINVEYEADDYAYVQDKRATQMFFIKGFTNATNIVEDNLLYNPSPLGTTFKKYIVVDMPSGLLTGSQNTAEEVKNRFLEDIDESLYFQALVELVPNKSDYVNGYLDIDKANVTFSGNKLYIPMKGVEIDKKNNILHPITKAGFQQLRLNRPELAYPDYDTKGKTFLEAMKAMGGRINEIGNLVYGFDYISLQKNWCQKVDVNNKSWIKLDSPNFKKLGGGIRVKKVTVSDEWNFPANNVGTKSQYGQVYSYAKEVESYYGRKTMQSTGVASFEPAVGGEENALRSSMPYSQKVRLAPDNFYYTERPIGEALYPAPVVGYSEVKVSSLPYANVTRTATGWSINTFYTAKDFPVITQATELKRERAKSLPFAILKFNTFDFHTASQGFSVEVNDMHGKPKSEEMYSQSGALLSSTAYSYKTGNKGLDNNVSTVGTDGVIAQNEVGVDMDIWQEMNEDETLSEVYGIDFTLDFGFWGFWPMPIPMMLPQFQSNRQRLRTAVTTKFIKRFGILDKVTKMENGSTITTENVLYDKETGQVLLTKTQNEFNDPIYNFSYPAHCAYDGMGQAYKNLGTVFTGVSFTNGQMTLPNSLLVNDFFTPGDEILVTNTAGVEVQKGKYYLVNVNRGSLVTTTSAITNLVALDTDGNTINENNNNVVVSNAVVRIIRSGRRNMPSASIGNFASTKSPISGNNVILDNATGSNALRSNSVFAASSTEFKDEWAVACGKNTNGTYINKKLNPYTSGNWGNWRPAKSKVFHELTDATDLTIASDIKTNGVTPLFVAPWVYNSTAKKWGAVNTTSWVTKNTMNKYDERGNDIENTDAIGIKSAAYYGFNQNLVTAVANNANEFDISFESFEDFKFSNVCNQVPKGKNIVLFRPNAVNGGALQEGTAHTGKYALSLPPSGIVVDSVLAGCPPSDGVGNAINLQTDNIHLINSCKACQGAFYPGGLKDLVFSIWVATSTSLTTNQINPAEFEVVLTDKNTDAANVVNILSLSANGPVIDGWQKLEGKFRMNAGKTNSPVGMKITLRNKGTGSVYFDDFRVLPYDAKMKAYVYDPTSLRLMAELDENHYATFYEYDDEGMLVRVKRETEKGIVTIKEVRTVVKPNSAKPAAAPGS